MQSLAKNRRLPHSALQEVEKSLPVASGISESALPPCIAVGFRYLSARKVLFHKMSKLVIPRKTVYRLSLYYRALQRLKANSVETVSSAALAKAAGVKPTQLRKDLTYFGQFGTRGLGYDVNHLSKLISDLLGTNSLQPVILVGVGNLGAA